MFFYNATTCLGFSLALCCFFFLSYPLLARWKPWLHLPPDIPRAFLLFPFFMLRHLPLACLCILSLAVCSYAPSQSPPIQNSLPPPLQETQSFPAFGFSLGLHDHLDPRPSPSPQKSWTVNSYVG